MKTFTFNWGEFSPGWHLALGWRPRAWILIAPIFGSFYINVPRRDRDQDFDAPQYKISIGGGSSWRTLFIYWGIRHRIIDLPWAWRQVRVTVLRPDGTAWKNVSGSFSDIPEVLKERHKFRYLRHNGETQECIATCSGEESEMRWRWFKWLPWPRRITRSLWLHFDQELGEGAGSWKGGVVGTGCDWKPGETMLDAIRRFEREAHFGR